MADAILGHRRIVGKPMHSTFNTTSTASILLGSTDLTSATLVDGLVQHDLVDPDVQVRILAAVDETGSAALEDIVAALEDHPKPAGAAFAMVAAGILQIESGIVDANSRLTRVGSIDDDVVGDQEHNDLAPADGGDASPAESATKHNSDNNLRRINVPTIYVPAIFTVSGFDRANLRREPLLDRPGVYAAFWGAEVYVGASKAITKRLTKGQHVVAPRPADRIIAIVDVTDQLSWDGAQIAERLLYRKLTASQDLKGRHDEPSGGQVDAVTYELVHDFVETALAALRDEGLFSPVPPPGPTMLAGTGKRDALSIFATKAAPASSQSGLYRLEACGVAARARVDGDSWTLLAGSQVRGNVMPSAHPSARRRRIELLHSGGLVKKGSDYLLTEDLSFGSATGPAHFVVGSKTSVDIWRAEGASGKRPLKH